jgi:hypothetical protein
LAGAARADEGVYPQLLRSTAWVVTPNGTASGVLVDRDKKLLATNFHVVGLHPEVRVVFPNYRGGEVLAEKKHYLENLTRLVVKGKVVARDPRRDLALVQLQEVPRGVEAVKLADKSPRPGQQVHSIGNPGASDALWQYSSGTVRQVYDKCFRMDNSFLIDARVVETQSPINPGDSGGPVVDDQGRLVALVSATQQSAQLVSLCIDVRELRSLLKGENKTIDPRVRGWLNEVGLKHSVDDLGVYRVNFRLPDGSTHVVFVDSEAVPVGERRLRRVWAVAQMTDKGLPADVANRLLRDNGRFPLAAWELRKLGDKQCVIFCARITDNIRPEYLQATMQGVLGVAYQMRKELSKATLEGPTS